MIITKVLLSIALVFIALVLACAVRLGRRRDTPAKPSFGYTRADLEALTERSRARAASDPLGLRRPLFFRSVRSPSARCEEADGGDPLHTGFPAVRYFRLIRGDREEASHV
ncbi:hypothetical protein EOW77_0003415 [Bradyrhizobium yuanmingense]|uniref:hypothetical protein n=1 Tax=Bradyrhizobium yuanmingense TaxID=108015 RepID=UPI000FE35635|nr:hypothetical protein [Bradyrhizobium yuanmingense]TGN90895.1 hypothetical protein EOW77_0003415 [Bradyrhizobium yuanmingense]